MTNIEKIVIAICAIGYILLLIKLYNLPDRHPVKNPDIILTQ